MRSRLPQRRERQWLALWIGLALTLSSFAGVLAAATPPGERQTAPPPAGEMRRCHELILAGQLDAARARLAPIVAAHPGWQRATFFLGLTYHEAQRHAEARPLLERALALDPASDDVVAIRLHLGWALYYLGDLTASRDQMEQVVKLRPEHPDGHFALGLIDFDDDAIDSATARFRQAIDLARREKDARSEGKARARLADVLVRTGDLAAARNELEAAVRLRPDAYEAYFKLSRVLERLGEGEGAARARAKHDEVRERVRPTEPPR